MSCDAKKLPLPARQALRLEAQERILDRSILTGLYASTLLVRFALPTLHVRDLS